MVAAGQPCGDLPISILEPAENARVLPKGLGPFFRDGHMDRRVFLASALAFASAPLFAKAQQAPKLVSVVRPTIVKQRCGEWCWAASASMIFGHLGHAIDQTRIVEKVYDGLLCVAARPVTITTILNVPWVDDDSKLFVPQIEARFDQSCAIDTLTSAFILDELLQDRMLLYASTRHCVAVSGAYYFETPAGPKIVSVIVMDPWPGGPDERFLTEAEMRPAFLGGEMTYLAAVRI